MNLSKRIRIESDESDTQNNHRSKDYSVCDPCRVKKIKCDREKPYCSNCSRLGQDCSYHGQGKKPSVTTALNNTVKIHESRLENLEGCLSEIQESLAKLEITRMPSLTPCPSFPVLSPEISPTLSQFNVRYRSNRNTVQSEESCERYMGPMSLQSLILDVQEFVLEPLCHESNPQQSAFSASDSLNELLELRIKVESIDDDSPPATPPPAILEAMMGSYFNLVSPSLPIWTFQGFQRLLNSNKSRSDANRNRIYAVSCNNMILLTLTAKFLRSESRRLVHSTEKQRLSSMELELINPFVMNAKRAVNKMEQFLFPSLANVQAFLSLCLVAQQYLTDDIFSLVYHQAVYLARSIGLDYSQLSTSNLSSEFVQERRNVLDCLCILGTSVSWMTGFHSGFVTLETTAALVYQNHSSDNEWQSRLKLAYLQDQVFSLLYSPGQQSKTVYEIQHAVLLLKQELEHWWKECGVSVGSGEPILSAQVEQAISYYSIKILLDWPNSNWDKASQSVLDDSRSCLKTFIRAWEMEAELGHYVCLSRVLISYPPVAFIQLVTNYINNVDNPDSRAEDLKTLRSFVRVIQIVTDLSETKSYTTRLSVFTQTMTNFAAAYESPLLCKPLAILPEQLHTGPSISDEDCLETLMVNTTADYAKNSYQKLETITSFHQNSNSPFLFSMPDACDDFFATSLPEFPTGTRENDMWTDINRYFVK